MDSSTPTIGLLADPGMPKRIATKIASDVAEHIHREIGARWRVEISEETLPLAPDGNLQLLEHGPQLRLRHNWDYVVYLTDLPRYVEGVPMLCEVSARTRTALISVPALGFLRLAARTRALVVTLVCAAAVETTNRPDPSAVEAALGRADVHLLSPHEQNDLVIIVLRGRARPLRMLGGMVRSNQPGSLLPVLTGCFAAAIGTGAFGVFFGTVVPLSDTMSSLRLVLISLLVIAALSAWLIGTNNLWNRARGRTEIWRRTLDNASTVITVGVSVALLYLVLFAVMLVMAFVVIGPGYLESQILHPAGFGDYVDVGWLAASLGTMAGALGANFDSDEAVRQATYSRRYHERRELFDTYENQQQDT